MPAPAPPPQSVPQGPSEYTQMMRTPSAAPLSPQAGAPPQAPQMQMPMPQFQMPQAPQVQMQAPQIQMPQVSMAPMQAPQMPTQVPVKAPGSNMLLIAIFCLLAFLVGALLMVLLLKK